MWDENESRTLFDDFDDQWGTFHIQECFISIPPLFLLMTGAICFTYMSDILVSPFLLMCFVCRHFWSGRTSFVCERFNLKSDRMRFIDYQIECACIRPLLGMSDPSRRQNTVHLRVELCSRIPCGHTTARHV